MLTCSPAPSTLQPQQCFVAPALGKAARFLFSEFFFDELLQTSGLSIGPPTVLLRTENTCILQIRQIYFAHTDPFLTFRQPWTRNARHATSKNERYRAWKH